MQREIKAMQENSAKGQFHGGKIGLSALKLIAEHDTPLEDRRG